MALTGTTQQIAIANLYSALCNRTPDAVGFSFWVNAYQGGASLQAIAEGFVSSPEARAIYPAAQTSAQFVSAVYAAVFGRSPDAGGLAFWTAALESDGGSALDSARAKLVLQIISVVSTQLVSQPAGLSDAEYALTIADRTRFINKAEVGIDFATVVKSDDVGLAKQVMAIVIDTAASVEAAKALARGLGQGGGAEPPIRTVDTAFTLTTGQDDGYAFTGGTGNDTFTAVRSGVGNPANTLNDNDVLIGGTGNDALNITVTQTDTNVLGSTSIAGIETINIAATGGATAIVAVSAATGVKSVNASGAGSVTITGLATGASVGIVGDGAGTNGTVAIGYATATDAVTLNVSGGTKGGTIVFTPAGTPSTVTIKSSGVANALGLTDFSTGQTVTQLNVKADTDLTASLASDYAANAALTITGPGKVNFGGSGTFASIDASASSGGLTMTLSTATASFKGSTGNDTVSTAALTVPSAAPFTGIIDGGAGSDTLVVVNAAHVASAPLRALYAGFETLNNATNSTIDATFAGVTTVTTSAVGGGFSNLSAAQAAAVNVAVDLVNTKTSYGLAVDGGSDVLGLVLKGPGTSSVINALVLDMPGFETLNLTVSSGGATLYNAAGTTLLSPSTDYSAIDFFAAPDLKTINLSGKYVAQINVGSNVSQISTVDASSNEAGLQLAVGAQAGPLVVTGTASRDSIIIADSAGTDTRIVNTGAGDDAISSGHASLGDLTLDGGLGTDVFTFINTNNLTVDDTRLAGLTGIEKLVFNSQLGLTLVVGANANSLATASSGVLDVTAAALTGPASIDASALAVGNSLTLTLTNVDTGANATTTQIKLSRGADQIKYSASSAVSTDMLVIGGDAAALAATTAKTIDLSGLTAGLGAVTVTTGAGADVIKAAGIAGTYTGGQGTDTFTAGVAVDTFAFASDGSVVGAMDTVNGFGAGADVLSFSSANLLAADATALAAGINVQQSAGGKLAFAAGDNSWALKMAAVQADVQLDAANSVAFFEDGADTYVYYAGTAIGNADDQVVKLAGVTGLSAIAVAGSAITIA
jgi:hypothetical protein